MLSRGRWGRTSPGGEQGWSARAVPLARWRCVGREAAVRATYLAQDGLGVYRVEVISGQQAQLYAGGERLVAKGPREKEGAKGGSAVTGRCGRWGVGAVFLTSEWSGFSTAICWCEHSRTGPRAGVPSGRERGAVSKGRRSPRGQEHRG